MRLRLEQGLPFVSLSLMHGGRALELDHILLDTGSAGSVFSADRLLEIGVVLEPQDTVHRIHGVGGAEFVFSKRIDAIQLGELRVANFTIEVGAMEYGFPLEGILGMDFFLTTHAVIDLSKIEIYPG